MTPLSRIKRLRAPLRSAGESAIAYSLCHVDHNTDCGSSALRPCSVADLCAGPRIAFALGRASVGLIIFARPSRDTIRHVYMHRYSSGNRCARSALDVIGKHAFL
jgi:hypothetical protein